ncbi:hypothetical protein CU098_004954, partial [Rhizopus stolonifer]
SYKSICPPPYSPELNPIEQFWSVVMNKVKRGTFSDAKDLRTRIAEVCNNVPTRHLKAFVQHSCDQFDKFGKMAHVSSLHPFLDPLIKFFEILSAIPCQKLQSCSLGSQVVLIKNEVSNTEVSSKLKFSNDSVKLSTELCLAAWGSPIEENQSSDACALLEVAKTFCLTDLFAFRKFSNWDLP